jgi:hypothetical protein
MDPLLRKVHIDDTSTNLFNHAPSGSLLVSFRDNKYGVRHWHDVRASNQAFW